MHAMRIEADSLPTQVSVIKVPTMVMPYRNRFERHHQASQSSYLSALVKVNHPIVAYCVAYCSGSKSATG